MSPPVELVLSRLPDAKRAGQEWKARCPAHEDRTPSLSIGQGEDGRALLFCHAGCPVESIVSALGLSLANLMPGDKTPDPRPALGVSVPSPVSPPQIYTKAQDAVDHLERRNGSRTEMWTYHDAQGEPVGLVLRWDRPGGGKDIRPVSRNGTGWTIGGMPRPRPLYRLPELRAAGRVYVCEGEKAADAVRSLGLISTTSPHGSKSAGKTDWSILAGKDVVVLPDNDDAGEEYAQSVEKILASLNPPPSVRIVNLPGLPPGGDAVEFVAGLRSRACSDDDITDISSLRELFVGSVDADTLGARGYQPFPTSVLPEPVKSFVEQAARAMGCDASYIALPMLSALAAAIGNARRIRLKRGWSEPAVVWTAIIGESGTLKTPAFRLVVGPLRDRQGQALKRHAEEMKQHEADVLRHGKALAAWKRKSAAQGDAPEKPECPEAERIIVSDVTVEALAPILLANPKGILVARDELAGWIGSFDRYAGQAGADAANWLSMHAADSIVVDRKTGTPRTIYVPSAAVSICGGIQPAILDRIMGVDHRESGMLARLLLANPPRKRKRWTEATITRDAHDAMRRLFGRLFDLQPTSDEEGTPRPVIIPLSDEGKATWIAFYNEHAAEQAELTGGLSAAWSKLEGYAARLALIVHLVRCAADDPTLANAEAVDSASVAAGIELSRWFGNEARRVYAILEASSEDREQQELIRWISDHGGSVSVRELARGLRTYRGQSKAAKAALDELVEAGKGQWRCPAPTVRGGRPAVRFHLRDSDDSTKTPASDPVKGGFGTTQRE